jgi:hypothetical protein
MVESVHVRGQSIRVGWSLGWSLGGEVELGIRCAATAGPTGIITSALRARSLDAVMKALDKGEVKVGAAGIRHALRPRMIRLRVNRALVSRSIISATADTAIVVVGVVVVVSKIVVRVAVGVVVVAALVVAVLVGIAEAVLALHEGDEGFLGEVRRESIQAVERTLGLGRLANEEGGVNVGGAWELIVAGHHSCARTQRLKAKIQGTGAHGRRNRGTTAGKVLTEGLS